MATFNEAKTKDCPQVPDVSPMTGWLGSTWLQKKASLWGLRPTPVPVRPRWAKTQGGRTSLCRMSPSVHLRQGPVVPKPCPVPLHLGARFGLHGCQAPVVATQREPSNEPH